MRSLAELHGTVPRLVHHGAWEHGRGSVRCFLSPWMGGLCLWAADDRGGLLVLVVASALAVVGLCSSVQGATARERQARERRFARQLMNIVAVMFVLIGFVAGSSAMLTITQRFLMLGAFAVLVAVAAQSARSYEVLLR